MKDNQLFTRPLKGCNENMLEYVILCAIKPNVDKYIWGALCLLGILWVKKVKRKSLRNGLGNHFDVA